MTDPVKFNYLLALWDSANFITHKTMPDTYELEKLSEIEHMKLRDKIFTDKLKKSFGS